jgi:hypothetical protein
LNSNKHRCSVWCDADLSGTRRDNLGWDGPGGGLCANSPRSYREYNGKLQQSNDRFSHEEPPVGISGRYPSKRHAHPLSSTMLLNHSHPYENNN